MKYSSLKLFYRENKKKSPLIVFIHGAACDHTLWCFQRRYFFNRGYSTLALDLPGHGKNTDNPLLNIYDMRKMICDFLKKVPQDDIILIGHSMGSLIALDSAFSKITKIKKIFLIGIAYPMQVSANLLNKSKNNQDDAILDMINWSLPAEIKLTGANLTGLNLPNLVSVIMGNAKNGILFKDLNACNKYKLKEVDIKSISQTFTIITGDRDIMTPYKSAENLNQLLSNSKLIKLKDTGHFAPLEKPVEINRLIEKTLDY